jgi:exopolysaccharide biosynthesis protein
MVLDMNRTKGRSLHCLWIFVIVLTFIVAGGVAGQTGRRPDIQTREALAPGVEHLEIRRGDFSTEAETDRWIINALLLDPRRARITLAIAMDEVAGTESTSSIAARYAAMAAINGGYFQMAGVYRGDPAGMLVMGANVLSEPSRPRSELAVANTEGVARISIGQVDVKAEIIVDGQTVYPVSGFNRQRERDELIVYTSEFHRTTLSTPDGLEAVIEGGVITAVRDGAGSQTIPKEGFVLSATGLCRGWARNHLLVGGRVEVRSVMTALPPLPFPPDFIIGGGPVLVKGGNVIAPAAADAEQFGEELSRKRHPRTAIGVRADGFLVLVTVDGRQPKKSVGMTLEELAILMRDFGCVEAMNLDGGGSTTMVLNGRVVNNPSDAAGERPVSDALLVFRR